MKVYVITQDVQTKSGGVSSPPVAVVLDKTGVAKPYKAEAFTVIGSAEQISAVKAFNEVAGLSAAAKEQLGLDKETLIALEMEAAFGTLVTSGKSLKVDVYRGIDGRDFPTVRGVYAYDPKCDPYTTYEEFTVAETLKCHFEQEKRKAVQSEISGLSNETKNFLAMRRLKPRG
ncbi:MAG: hypothetical protein EPN97_10475 [Alphaproteobacteria bacterium]|nr:MAG: hypothetical protein EPN97_10475 [Alphaproteobacteria bacterium]